jgi:hypothetical protein
MQSAVFSFSVSDNKCFGISSVFELSDSIIFTLLHESSVLVFGLLRKNIV